MHEKEKKRGLKRINQRRRENSTTITDHMTRYYTWRIHHQHTRGPENTRWSRTLETERTIGSDGDEHETHQSHTGTTKTTQTHDRIMNGMTQMRQHMDHTDQQITKDNTDTNTNTKTLDIEGGDNDETHDHGSTKHRTLDTRGERWSHITSTVRQHTTSTQHKSIRQQLKHRTTQPRTRKWRNTDKRNKGQEQNMGTHSNKDHKYT